MSKKKALYYTFNNRGLDPNKPWTRDEVLRLEKQVWYGVRGFVGTGHFETDSSNQPAGLPTGSSTMTIAWGARWTPRITGSGSPMLVRFGNGSNAGWLMQELPTSRRLGWTLGNSVHLANHYMEPDYNYTFTMTITGGLVSTYVNGLLFTTASDRTYVSPNPAVNPFNFGGSFNGAVPATNWMFNFFTISGDIALTPSEVSGWDKSIRQFGPQALPSASNFWHAKDLQRTGSNGYIVPEYWFDRIGNVGIRRLTGSNLILESYTPVIPTGSWT